MSSILSLTMLAETLRIAAPYACAAAGGVWAERSGVIRIGLEGVLLTSAFSSVAVANATGSAVIGLVAGVVAGVVVSVGHGLLVEKARVDAVVSGIALNLCAMAGTRLALAGSTAARRTRRRSRASASGRRARRGGRCSPGCSPIRSRCSRSWPWWRRRSCSRGRASACACAPPARTRRPPLPSASTSRACACPPSPSRAPCARSAACTSPSISTASSRACRTAGGFIALAAVVVSGWRAGRAALACLAFGALEALQIVLQDQAHASRAGDLVQLLPYVATLVVLGFAAGRSGAQKGLGRPAEE